MKKLLLLTLCVMLLLSMWGCRASGKPAPTVTPVCDAYVGMPMEEFWELYEHKDIVSMAGIPGVDDYYFIEDDRGNPMVLIDKDADGEYTIAAIEAYDKSKIELSSRSFFAIEIGMTVQEVISILGHPLGSFSAMGNLLTWRVDDTLYDVAFHSQPGDPSIFVVENLKSKPGALLVAKKYLIASAPYCAITSIGSTPLPKDLDIFLPCSSRIKPWIKQ